MKWIQLSPPNIMYINNVTCRKMVMLTVSRLINFHLDRQLRRYSESSSDLIISAKCAGYIQINRLSASTTGDISRRYDAADKKAEPLISPALEEIDIVELAELEGELEGGL